MSKIVNRSRKRNRYNTNVKLAVQLDILPGYLKQLIPKSTISGIKNTDLSDIISLDDDDFLQERIELAKKIIKSENLYKIYKACNRIKNMLIIIFSSIKNSKSHFKKFRKNIVETIVRVKDVLGLERACRYFRISVSCFYSWLHQVQNVCTSSAFNICRRKWPLQLTENEQNTMKECLSNPFYKGWAIYQIAVHSLLQNVLAASVSTWYKYIRIFGLHVYNIRKRKQKVGIRANNPNLIWHMDVTVYKTSDNRKAYIYILIDNFSRYILQWRVSLSLAGATVLNMLRSAYVKYLVPLPKDYDPTVLLSDGGSENNNKDVDDFLSQPHIPIMKLIAQKDIECSNSMVEAFNKTLKYHHLFPYEIRDYESLEKHLEKCIPEYNNVRSHYAHKYRTPSQVYFGHSVDLQELQKRLLSAQRNRIIENRNSSCTVCLE